MNNYLEIQMRKSDKIKVGQNTTKKIVDNLKQIFFFSYLKMISYGV